MSRSTSEVQVRLACRGIFYWPLQGALLLWIIYVISVLFLLCIRARLLTDALWSPAGKGLTSRLSFVMSNCEVVTFPLVSWVLGCIDSWSLSSFFLCCWDLKNSQSFLQLHVLRWQDIVCSRLCIIISLTSLAKRNYLWNLLWHVSQLYYSKVWKGVVFDGYGDGPSTKDNVHRRRTGGDNCLWTQE